MNDKTAVAIDTRRLSEQSDKDAFVRVVELIGEMGFGRGLPIDMPEQSSLVFDAIYQKLKNEPGYSPLRIAREKEHKLYMRIQELEDRLSRAHKVLNEAVSDL